ncbi:hypothetical protein B0H19DRAFT_1252032 [Mycena capillaripes]|nr:hypothetical protein B0H19DRAFT_1252032 [Mycena capillaripes]
MYGQVFQNLSTSINNTYFADEVECNGLPVWPWIISHDSSQGEAGRPLACTFLCLQFAKLVLGSRELQVEALCRTGRDVNVGQALAGFLQPRFFNEVLGICTRLGAPAHDVQDAQGAFQHLQLAPVLTPLLYGTHCAFSPRRVEAFIDCVTGLPSAMTLTYARHTRACVYVPHRTPLFLVFDSVQTFGQGASIVVHASHASAAAQITAFCPQGASGEIEANFFVATDTAVNHKHRARLASMELHLRFGDGRSFRDVRRRPPRGSSEEHGLGEDAGMVVQVVEDRRYTQQEEVSPPPDNRDMVAAMAELQRQMEHTQRQLGETRRQLGETQRQMEQVQSDREYTERELAELQRDLDQPSSPTPWSTRHRRAPETAPQENDPFCTPPPQMRMSAPPRSRWVNAPEGAPPPCRPFPPGVAADASSFSGRNLIINYGCADFVGRMRRMRNKLFNYL